MSKKDWLKDCAARYMLAGVHEGAAMHAAEACAEIQEDFHGDFDSKTWASPVVAADEDMRGWEDEA